MIKFKAQDHTGEIFNSTLTPFTFPAGEAHIKAGDRPLEQTEIAILQFTPESMAQDIMHYMMWADYISQHNYTSPYPENPVHTVLVLPYAPAARADRGAPFGAQVYSFLLATTGANQIIVFDPHSEVVVEQLDGTNWNRKDSEVTVVNSDEILTPEVLSGYDGIIAPDKGAFNRASLVAQKSDLPVYTVEKVRDFDTGKLLSFDASSTPKEGKFLIVDDICDGGGTFIGIAEATGLPPEQLDLFVSHGVFSKNALENLPKRFGKVITTNSFNPLRTLNGDLIEQAWAEDDADVSAAYQRAMTAYKRLDVIRPMLDKIKQPVYTGTNEKN